MPDGYDSWKNYDRWQDMEERVKTTDRMQREEFQFIQDVLDALSNSKSYEEFRTLTKKYEDAAMPTIKETVGFKVREITFPEGTFRVIVTILPRRGTEHASDPYQYNIFVRQVKEI